MKDMISVETGFQNSVNLGFDLHNVEKAGNFIPTNAALDFMEDIFKSVRDDAIDRARVLIGPYGKGKSHMVLTALALLLKRDISIFTHLLPKLEERQELKVLVDEYYMSEKKLLPVIITGSSGSIAQAFLIALERALRDDDLLDVMPETNYQAAIRCIDKWREEFPDTYKAFVENISGSVGDFVERLQEFDITAYDEFQKLYPSLTAGSTFNPFLGFDVVELYENVVKNIKPKGYTGIFVVYDEFSKYLEANIKYTAVSDTKLLQDFAEKCNRSGKDQIHLLLISHKEIANYIDQLPKQKTDGWRGVSERFKHIHFSDEYTQTYEIIDTVIKKNKAKWIKFTKKHTAKFGIIEKYYKSHEMFNDISADRVMNMLLGAYPLHPASLFILPRLSERVAQNERTLFTFLSSDGYSTLTAFLKTNSEDGFSLITPDYVFDYFQPLMEKEVHTGTIYKNYELAKKILMKITDNELEQKIIKILAAIYMVEQYDVIRPVKEELQHILEPGYTCDQIDRAIDELIAKEYVIYLKRSNGYLCLKQSSGINIYARIADTKEAHAQADIKKILNTLNFDRYMYPARYNDEKEMTRFFAVEFIYAAEVTADVNWEIKSEGVSADGIVYAIISDSEEELNEAVRVIAGTTKRAERYIFALPQTSIDIKDKIIELYSINLLRESAIGDQVLYNEYDLVYEDLYAILKKFLQGYTRPENKQVVYYHLGEKQKLYRKAQLSSLMSDICDSVYSKTPVINNEVINKDELTTTAQNSQYKVLAGILRQEVEPELGLSGFGQEVSIMRSTLKQKGLLTDENNIWELHKYSNKKTDEDINVVMNTIYNFMDKAVEGSPKSFGELYHKLIVPAGRIGLRRGLIPIYIAVALHIYKGRIIVYNNNIPVDISADVLQQINAQPGQFSLERIDWSRDREVYIQELEGIFAQYISSVDNSRDLFEHVARGMYNWYLSLPKYAKELTVSVSKEPIKKEYVKFIKSLKTMKSANDLLFQKIPQAFGVTNIEPTALAKSIAEAKALFDEAVSALINEVANYLRDIFSEGQLERASLQSIICDWCDELPSEIFEEFFEDGTDKFLPLCQQNDNNEQELLVQVAKMATGLRFNDWDKDTYKVFCERISQYKQTAENYVGKLEDSAAKYDEPISGYEFSYVNDKGKLQRRRFSAVEYTPRAKLLFNSIKGDIEAMGQSISEHEKRQVVAEILQTLC
ncbi:restriction endonuclease subunit S [Anaerovibrio sp.]|uniref:restriction endonuclease subunit S n=1 Tax=Anaerovibrio sp. TaxID=1872532 RepID=UPI0025C0857F|nr:restriction endonuclease subunit S [Anaerovibrio sp.]MBR2142528.1 restriction endonuclease subunit S [Anaerovibrio sp.]